MSDMNQAALNTENDSECNAIPRNNDAEILTLHASGHTYQQIHDATGYSIRYIADVIHDAVAAGTFKTRKQERDEKILELYSKNYTQAVIAKECECDPQTVWRAITEAKRTGYKTPKQIRNENIIKLYKENMDIAAIARACECSKRIVWRVTKLWQKENATETEE